MDAAKQKAVGLGGCCTHLCVNIVEGAAGEQQAQTDFLFRSNCCWGCVSLSFFCWSSRPWHRIQACQHSVTRNSHLKRN